MLAIVAVDLNWGIGYRGELLARIPADMKFFKDNTLGKVVVMGRETFTSLPGGEPLPDRVNIVLCEDRNFSDKDITVCASLAELWGVLKKYSPEEIFVIGGESVYAQLLPYCCDAYVTKIKQDYPADKYFPNLDHAEGWEMVDSGELCHCKNIGFRFTQYHNHQVIAPGR
jgi:dihydrofolate reductase